MGMSQRMVYKNARREAIDKYNSEEIKKIQIKNSEIYDLKFYSKATFRGTTDPDVIGYCTYFIRTETNKTGQVKWYEDNRKVYADLEMKGYIFYLNQVVPVFEYINQPDKTESSIKTCFKEKSIGILNNELNKPTTSSQKFLLKKLIKLFGNTL